MVYYFLVDLNNAGSYYRVGVLSDMDRDDVEKFWQGYSKDVRFLCAKEQPHVRSKGVRQIPVGIISSCNFFCHKYEPFRQIRIFAEIDTRMEVVNDATDEAY